MAGVSILCATDLSDLGPRVVELAIAAAKAFEAKLDLLHVIDDEDSWWPESEELEEVTDQARAHATRYEELIEQKLLDAQRVCEAAGLECEALVVRGRPWRVIPEVAKERASLMVVIGAFGSAGEKSVQKGVVVERVLGSTAERVVRAADRPVFVSTGETEIADGLQGTTWIVGTDFSDCSLVALKWAERAAARVGGTLHVANVVIPAGGEEKPDEERTWRQVLRDQSKAEAGKQLVEYVSEHAPNAEHHQVVSPDYPSHALCNAARLVEADVLVVGTHAQSVLGRLLIGSTASRCLRVAAMPVLMVPVATGT